MTDDVDDYEAGTELDPEAQAFLAREGKPGFVPTPEYDPAADPEIKAKQTARPVVQDIAAPDPVAKDPEPPEQTAEDKAAAMGWAPQDQWRGPPGKWVDADTFLKRGENNPRILRERLDATERKHSETIARMERMNQQALERQKAELDAERDRLLDQHAGDPRAVRQIVQNHAEAVGSLPDPKVEEAAAQVRGDWESKYSDIAADPVFRASAFSLMQQIIDSETQADVAGKNSVQIQEARFERLNAQLAKSPAYGRFFEQKPAETGAPPAGSRQMDGVRISGKRETNYVSRLPASARVQGERFVKQGLFPNLEAYAKDYVNQ